MRVRTLCLALAVASSALGAGLPLPNIELPKDSPVALMSSDYSGSSEAARGGALVLELHAALTLRNVGARRIRGVTLLVEAQQATPGGKASVTLAGLNAGAGESFPVRIDLRLLRPVQLARGGAVAVRLDGVLFDDLGFYGPNQLNSRRAMVVYEMEARRDRRYFKALLDAGPEKLRQGVLECLSRQASQPDMEIQVARNGRATNLEAGRQLELAMLDFPEAPVEPRNGAATIIGNEARDPRLEVRNRSGHTVRSVEVAWILRDAGGREFPAGSTPSEVFLAPGERRDILKDATLRFPERPGAGLAIAGMTGYVSSVEFADGKVWVPSRVSLGDARLAHAAPASPEEQRLMQIYRRRGLAALIDELKKF